MRRLLVVVGMVAGCGGTYEAPSSNDAGTPARDPNARAWTLTVESNSGDVHCEGTTSLAISGPNLRGLWTGQCSGAYSWSGVDSVFLDNGDQHFVIGIGNRNVVFCSAVAQVAGAWLDSGLCNGSGQSWQMHARPPPGS